MKFVLGSGKALGTTFLILQEEVCCSEYISSREASGLIFANRWTSALPTPGVADFLSRQIGIPLGFAREECLLLPEDNLLLALYAQEGREEFPDVFQENLQVSWVLLQLRSPLLFSPPARRELRLCRKEILEKCGDSSRWEEWFLAVNPRNCSGRVVSKNSHGNPRGLEEYEDFFPLSMVLERRDGYLPGTDWWRAPGTGEGRRFRERRSYRICWE